MKTILIAMLALALSGCAGWNALQGVISTRGAAVSAEARQSAEFVLCRGMSIGEWVRAYGSAPEKARAWQTLCDSSVQTTPAK